MTRTVTGCRKGSLFRKVRFSPLAEVVLCLAFLFHSQVSAQLQAVTAERDAATREVAELRRRIAEDRPTQEATAALQVCTKNDQ